MVPTRLTDLRRPVVLFAFSGWNDAGDAATGVIDHLTEGYETEFSFQLDPDEYYDLTENRPVLVRQDNGERSIQWATTEVLVARLPGQDLVLVNGPEPNLRWKAFCAALVSAFRSINPERVIAMGASPRSVIKSGFFMPSDLQASASSLMRPRPILMAVG